MSIVINDKILNNTTNLYIDSFGTLDKLRCERILESLEKYSQKLEKLLDTPKVENSSNKDRR
jgi:hypothetical protein